ncbi:MAG: hypothetical protein MI702_10735 [Chlorobiales bacterium]|nr:hypothetical protein [Chlorobiales bacterium]
MTDNIIVKAGELKNKIQRLAKQRGLFFKYDPKRGKGSHGTIYFGEKRTFIKDLKKECSKGYVSGFLAQLGLNKEDIE